jgi:hypothetical protein
MGDLLVSACWISLTQRATTVGFSFIQYCVAHELWGVVGRNGIFFVARFSERCQSARSRRPRAWQRSHRGGNEGRTLDGSVLVDNGLLDVALHTLQHRALRPGSAGACERQDFRPRMETSVHTATRVSSARL